MNSRNKRKDLCLKPIEVEYYSIGNLKSYSKYFVFCSTAIYQTGTVCGSFNIQYQSTGVGSLPSLSEIELRRSIRGWGLSTCGTFRWTCLLKIFFENIDKTQPYFQEENKSNETIRRLVINQSSGPMPIDETRIVRLFLCSV